MSNSWHNTSNDLDAEKHTTEFWTRHSDELKSGEFWADRIKNYKGEPAKRLKIALENMPLPASFREVAIATRALIREKKLKGLPFTYKNLGYTELNLLNKTDVKWLIESWGEPEIHSTLHSVHFDVWQVYEDKLKHKRNSDPLGLSLDEPESKSSIQIEHKAQAPMPTEKSGNGKKILFVIGFILIVAFILAGKG